MYVNINVGTGTPGTVLDAVDRNITQEELVNAVVSAAQTLDPTGVDEYQLARALSIIGASASSCYDTGAVNAYAPTPLLTSMIKPTAYSMMHGFVIFFKVSADNTGACTCNYAGLGAKSITMRTGSAPAAGVITETVFLIYNLTNDRWEYLFSSKSASAGVASLTGESGVVTIGGTPSIPHISLTAGGISTAKLAAGAVEFSKCSDSSTEALNVKKRLAKAWINFNGVTGSIRDDFNITSITKVSTAHYTVTLDVDMPSANYVVLTGVAQDADDETGAIDNVSVYNLAAGSFSIVAYNSGDRGDLENILLLVLGD